MNVLKRIKDLMARSHSDNVHEAASAATMAQALMMEHKIELADLELTGQKRLPEEVVEDAVEGDKNKRSTSKRWRVQLSSRLSRSFNCKVYFQTGTDYIGIMGCKSDVQTVQYLQQYFALEIERLCSIAWNELKAEAGDCELPRATVWKSSFRDGAVHAIGERMDRERIKSKIRMGEKAPVNNPVLVEELTAEVAVEAAQGEGLVASSQAMVLVRESEKEREETVAKKWTERFTNKYGRSTLRGHSWKSRAHSQDGYGAGKAAGAGIPMTNAKAGIGGAKPRLEG